ncbi:MAG TPA: hypothetical protein VFS43_19725 [Polyangiaceae bacterium]|nr:hypothetical protein [Polyangiaceae bacterium]
MTGVRVVVVGGGDLGVRVACALAAEPWVSRVVLVARREREGAARAFFAAACGPAPVAPAALDALETERLHELLDRERAGLIMQCASLLSPWALHGRHDPATRALRAAGFAAQLPAQLPIARSVARAASQCRSPAPVVNCSYPDVVNPVLAAGGLAPLAGVGNAGMIAGVARAALNARGGAGLVRVLAHHGHVTASMTADPSLCRGLEPRVYLGEGGAREDGLAFAGPPLASSRELNALTAAHALAVLRALAGGGPELRTSVPGPLGLPGGYPVRIAGGRLALDLPPGLPLAEATALQRRYATLDGVEAIAGDGTVTFTEAARERLASLDPGLASPLHPDEALERHRRLERFVAAP